MNQQQLATRLNALNPRQREALLQRLRAEGIDLGDFAGIPRAGARPWYPVSLPQQRLWFLEQLAPGTTVYGVATPLRFRGRLDAGALARSLAEVVRRHAPLRTSYPAVDGLPVQVVEPAAKISQRTALPVIDLSALPESAREGESARLTDSESWRPFDIERGPVLRTLLLRRTPDDHTLLIGLHHIACDFWSVAILLSELTRLYAAETGGAPASLPALPVEYPDFAVWQRERDEDETAARELAFWRERLAGAPAVLEIPADRPRPRVRSFRGGSLPFALDAADFDAVKALARREGGTPYMVLLAGFKALLHRVTGQEDLVVGTPTAGRNRTELEGLIGCFINALALRTDLSGAPSFQELVRRVRQTVLTAQANANLPFERVVDAVQPGRDLGTTPIFQVLFVLQTAPPAPVALPGLELSLVDLESRKSEFDFSVSLWEDPSGLRGSVEYDAEIFEEATARRLVRHLERLTARAAAEPAQGIAELPLLDEAERRQLLNDWNRTADLQVLPLSERIAEQARRTPDAPAVLFGDERLSYAELDAFADRLARHLRGLGVGPDVPVGVCLERSLRLPAVLLGVLRSGGFWVPLDPAYPADRLAWMVADTGARVLIADGAAAAVPFAAGLTVLSPDHLEGEEPIAEPLVPAHPEATAYVIYTSGSTGRPKGVAVPHRALAHHATAVAARYGLGADDCVLQFTSISFDVTCEEIFPTWTGGGAVVPRPAGLFPAFDELERLVEHHGITVLNLPTAYWHEWAADLHRAARRPPASLRLVVVGTEAALPEPLARWIETAGVRWINGYGATETTITVLTHEPGPDGLARAQAGIRVPVGTPLPGSRVYVLDGRLEPAAVGTPGEVWLGGPHVARGYLGRPELTAERFLPDPYAAAPGQRLYRTGDLGRWRNEGDLEILGRADRQVKIRGFRVEPGEVESVLLGCAGVREVAVDVRETRPGDRRLVAWVVAESGRELTADGLRAAAGSVLPEAMRPAAWVFVPALPLTANGKLDRRALPDPQGSDLVTADVAYAAPEGELEAGLATIFSEVLGGIAIGRHEDFFRSGGHSLLATQVVSRVRAALDLDLPLRTLFERPTVAGLAEAISALRTAATPGAPRVTRSPLRDVGGTGEPFPLSFSQERLWFLDQLEPGTPAYNIPAAVRLRGRLDADAFARSLSEIVRRHEALRTVLPALDGQAIQQVLPARPQPLPCVDLSALPVEEREAEKRRIAAAEAKHSFDLTRGPLLRTVLLRLEPEDHLLTLVVHHIVADGWSLVIFERELAVLYAAFVTGRPSPLPEPELQYADFADWQRRWLSGAELDRQLAWWRGQLAGVPVLELRGDRPRPPVQSFRGGQVPFALGPELTAALTALAHREGASLFMALLTGFQILLHRSTGQDDFAVGTFIANRNRAETEGLIGFFVNNLALRTDLSGDPGFATALRRTRETTLGAYAHQDLPFEKLLEELRPERDMSRSSIFQAMCMLLNLPEVEERLPGLTLAAEATESTRANFDISLWLSEGADGVSGVLEYNADILEAATARRMAGHLRRLFEGAVATPAAPVSTLPLLSAAERGDLATWSTAPAPWDAEVCIHQLFERQAARTPDGIAVVSPAADGGPGDSLTYAALNRRANQLARRLRRLGVGAAPEVRVGICLERSTDLIAAVLAVLKAGGCYVPLDPAYSRDRLAFMLEDSRAGVVVTSAAASGSLPELEGLRVLRLDAAREAIERESAEDLPVAESGARPEHLAYTIYTSGSTGRPKGAMIEHRSLVNAYLAWEVDYRLRTEATTHLQMASFSFDVFGGDLVRALLSGGRLVLCPRELLLEPDRLYELMVAEGVDSAEFVPSVVRGLIDGGRPLDFMRLMIVGSDAWYVGELRGLARLCGERTRVINSYGASEAAVDTTFFELPAGGGAGMAAEGLVPIGRPFGGSEVFILDRNLELAPVGVPGELAIGGINLARGYHDRPELSAERFVPHPFATVPGSRIYRTGDLARWLPDGNVEFLGRVDNQVKVRGHRIEPGEIEAALGEHPGVRQAVVLAVPDRAGEKRLAAYVVPREAASDETAGLPTVLRAFVRQKLPEFMVPSVFAILAEMPLTPNGKVDRRALAALDLSTAGVPEGNEGFVAPRNAAEELLAAQFAEVLRRDRVSADGHFFELGGHSLLATQLMSRVRKAFGLDLPLRVLFETPTVAGLARRIETARQEAQRAAAPPILPVPRDAHDLPLSFAQQRLWFLDQMEPGSPFYNLPVALRLSGPLDVEALAASLDEVLRRHEALRVSFVAENGRPRQAVQAELRLALAVEDLGSLPEERRLDEALRLAREDAELPFDLSRPPLLRARLLRLAAEEHVVLLTMHHIVSDAWSIQVLVAELAALYAAFAAGQPSPLPELPVQYADFAAWQRSWLAGEVLDAQLAWWRDRLGAPLPPALDLPTDRPRPAAQTFRGERLPVALDAELSRGLARVGARTGATPFMTLLAAFEALLARSASQTDFAVGTPIANRNRGELEGLIGFFVNTLALRADLSGHPTFETLVGRVREMALGAYAHQDLPFDRLIEALNPPRDPSRSPLFQVMFVFQNAPASSLAGAGLSLEALEIETGTAKFDLGLELYETPDGLRGSFEINTGLFDRATGERMARQLRVLLEGVAEDPARPVDLLPLLAAEERREVLLAGRGPAPVPAENTVLGLFEARAALQPGAFAMQTPDGRTLTYAALDRRAEALAHVLRTLGVGPEVPVAAGFDRSPELLVALLGVWKAGGVWLPLDPEQPRERLAAIVEDAGAPVLLTRSELLGALPESPALRLCLDRPESFPPAEATPLPVISQGDRLAYVIYTSGSTGRPKGVMVPHLGLRNLIVSMVERLGLRPGDRVSQLISTGFDASLLEVSTALASGATLVPGDRVARLPGEDLRRWLGEQGITHMVAVPSMLAATPSHGLGRLRAVTSGAERLPAGIARRWSEGRRLFNCYGPTETTVLVTIEDAPGTDPGPQDPPIGRPVPGATAHVLDARLEPVPAGIPGDLYIGGDALARGYLGRPDLTAERFVPDPFGAAGGGFPGGRLYRTGDRARRRPDGRLEFLGRADRQVKIRGVRVELGEVEGVLETHPGVQQAAVMVHGAAGASGAAGNARLAAYVVPRATVVEELLPELPAALRAFLREQLPEAMVPSSLILLERMPLTATGKADLRALPEPAAETLAVAEVAVARTPTEEIIAAVWADVLGLERVGADSHFFELGGHSLLATQAVSRLREVFSLELPLRLLFERPTPAALAEAVEELRGAGSGAAVPPLVAVPHGPDDLLPLSFAQQRLWLLDRLQPGSSAYNLPLALRLSGPLDAAALEWSLGEIVRRHEALRTTFGVARGLPVQRIAPAGSWSLPRIDLSGLPAEVRESEAGRLSREEGERPFDLERDAMLRCLLLRLTGEEHVALATMHHIASDGWSMGVLVRELGALYAARRAGNPSPLAELTVQYADFAAWQTGWLQGDALEAQLAFWRAELDGAPTVLELPVDHPRTTARTYQAGHVAVTVPAATAEGLRRIAQSQGATLFMTLLAGFEALLSRLTGQEDLVVGTPVANRHRREVEDLIGFFVNTLPLRGRPAGTLPFAGLVERARTTALGAYAHQDLPFERLVDELRVERSLSHNPLFQVVFALQNTPEPPLELAGLRWEALEGARPAAQFDLSLALAESGSEIVGTLEYAADLFDAATVSRLAEHLLLLLAGAADAPATPVAELPLLSPSMRDQLLLDWSGAGVPAITLPEVGTVVDALEVWARRTPEAPAVRFGGEVLTHGELDRRAGRLARRLRDAGVAHGTPVALCLERSLDLPVALLATFRAGGAFLPVDPAHPDARKEYLLRDSGAVAVIADGEVAEALAASGLPVLRPQMEGSAEDAPLADLPAADDLAYLIYTSGTTGEPKAVAVEHRHLITTLHALQADYAWSAADRAVTTAPFSFDIFLAELFMPLASGGSVELMPLVPVLDFDRLAEALEDATCYHGVPSLMRQLALSGRTYPGMRAVFTGGEAVPPDLLASLAEVFPAARLGILYGPTEAAIVCTRHLDARGVTRGQLLGRPFAGAEIRLCDPLGQPVPQGIPGELWVGGAGVARGYLGRPALTAERFVPAEGGGRFFRTGDLARWLPGGELEFLGRIDHQVKVRGFRIELGEIEAVLAAHPAVREAVVLARGEGADRRLVAYVVPDGEAPGPDALRRHLGAALPEYMVPAVFMVLGELPLTAHGKVDRKALPDPGRERPDFAAAYVAPRSALEEVLIGLWVEILDVERIGVEDDFFALGGHSLLATQLLSWVRDSFQIEIPLRRVFEQPTVAGMAEALREGSGDLEALERTAELLLQVSDLSEDEVEMLLQEKSS